MQTLKSILVLFAGSGFTTRTISLILKQSKMRVLIIFILSVILCLTAGVSASVNENAGNSSAQFLKMSSGCRATALGDTATSVGGTVESLFYNPAGIGYLDHFEIMVSYSKWFEEMNYTSAALGISMGKAGTIGIGFSGLFYGDIPIIIKDSSGKLEEKGNTTANDMSVQAGYGKEIGKIMSVGINVKMLNQTLEKEKAVSFGIDAGCMTRLIKDRLGMGVAVQNIGTKAKFMKDEYDLPQVVRGGVSFEILKLKNHNGTIAADVKKAKDEDIKFSAGLEYGFRNLIYIRGGYQIGNDVNDYTAGGGIRVPYRGNFVRIDYAFEPYGVLGETHRIGLVVGLGGK